MDVNSLPKTVTRQRLGCDLNPGPSAPESSTLTTRLPSHPMVLYFNIPCLDSSPRPPSFEEIEKLPPTFLTKVMVPSLEALS